MLPVSSLTAQALLADMRGVPGPAHWAGALAVPYVVGQTRSQVHLRVQMRAAHSTLWNTVGELRGTQPESTVIAGAHRDAWVYGVSDDGSGIAALLETARGLGELHRRGWTPQRTIRLIGFDAEELGELGSHAYVNAHLAELQRGCVAYINVDEAVSGPTLAAGGVAALRPSVERAASDIDGVTLHRYGSAGGGSDFEAFLYTAGVPILNLGYEGPLGVYHSTFDDYTYMSRILDPGFVRHRAVAQTVGVLLMQYADAAAMPYALSPYAEVLTSGVAGLTKLAAGQHVAIDSASLDAAIRRFADAAAAFDAQPDAAKNERERAAVLRLDAMVYSANGYASVAFPAVAAAIARGDSAG
ncbi:MAG TPA: M28 family peptidase, partial [Candidatus Baltobacteraceae bacterium]|nr:M28 family peptidase [Candidatus Baltobacteraceae bacterium]